MRQSVRPVALCVLLLFLSFQAEAKPTFRFVQEGKRLYLSEGKSRLLWAVKRKTIDKQDYWQMMHSPKKAELGDGEIQLISGLVLFLPVEYHQSPPLNDVRKIRWDRSRYPQSRQSLSRDRKK